MKKTLLIMICCAMLTSMASCNTNNNVLDSDGTETTTTEESTVSDTYTAKTSGEAEMYADSIVHIEDDHNSSEGYSFLNEKVGYYFYFGPSENFDYMLLEFKKTVDGGENWSLQQIDKVPCVSPRERFICAKMLDENVGFIAAGHQADDNVSRRTYITTDGGINWEQVVLPPHDRYTEGDSGQKATYLASGEAYDLTCENGRYVLYFRLHDKEPIYFQYISTDLKTWNYVEK